MEEINNNNNNNNRVENIVRKGEIACLTFYVND